MKKLILVNPQWQGSGKLAAYEGAMQLYKAFFATEKCVEVPTSVNPGLELKNKIWGYEEAHSQMNAALEILRQENPEKLLVIGGSCDAGIAPAYYMNEKYAEDLAVLWIDAHADLNSPETSGSHLLYGMPMRILLGCNAFQDILCKPLAPKQFINYGGWDFDEAEVAFLEENSLPLLPSNSKIEEVLAQLEKLPYKKLFIHFDFDALLAKENPQGIKEEQLLETLAKIKESCQIVGMGFYHYTAQNPEGKFLESLVKFAKKI